VVDLGADRIYQYRVEDEGELYFDLPFISTSPGMGPRQMTFDDNGLVYVNGELDTIIEVYRETEEGLQGPISTARYEVEEEEGRREQGAEMRLHNGHLYVSHRGAGVM